MTATCTHCGQTIEYISARFGPFARWIHYATRTEFCGLDGVRKAAP